LFDVGIPFYTKEVIRDVFQQLEKFGEKGQKVWVRGLDGIMVDFDIESGLTLQAGHPTWSLSGAFIGPLMIQDSFTG
jgi:hypothetical protein